METAGQKLKRVRERLKLRYRDVAEASRLVAERRGNAGYRIALSRLSDIENKGTVPTIYRLYTLCAIYRLEMEEVMRWYEVDANELGADAASVGLDSTHLVRLQPLARLAPPPEQTGPGETDSTRTAFLGHVQRWGRLSAGMLRGFDPKHHRLGYIGLEDRAMSPLVRPGSVVIIDERQRKIATGGWTSEFDRPIYFLEHREGYRCGWCALADSRLVLQPHPASQCPPQVYRYPSEIEVVGRVVGVAMLMDARNQKTVRAAVARAGSPDR